MNNLYVRKIVHFYSVIMFMFVFEITVHSNILVN